VEKKMIFERDDKIYVYFSSVPDGFKELNSSKESRAQTIAGFHVFETLEDGR
jgi:hypothetical protein